MLNEGLLLEGSSWFQPVEDFIVLEPTMPIMTLMELGMGDMDEGRMMSRIWDMMRSWDIWMGCWIWTGLGEEDMDGFDGYGWELYGIFFLSGGIDANTG